MPNEQSNKETVISEAESARRLRNKFRLIGSGIGFVPMFVMGIFTDDGLVTGIVLGLFFGLCGYVIAEIARHFVKSQRNAVYESETHQTTSNADNTNDQDADNTNDQDGSIGNWVWNGMIAASVIAISSQLFTFFSNGTPAIGSASPAKEYYNCGESVVVEQCEVEGNASYDCLFTNKTRVVIDPSDFGFWSYDDNKILTKYNRLHSTVSIPPERTVHVQFIDFDDSSEHVLCSVDPYSNIVGGRSNWTRIQ